MYFASKYFLGHCGNFNLQNFHILFGRLSLPKALQAPKVHYRVEVLRIVRKLVSLEGIKLSGALAFQNASQSRMWPFARLPDWCPDLCVDATQLRYSLKTVRQFCSQSAWHDPGQSAHSAAWFWYLRGPSFCLCYCFITATLKAG